MCNAQCTVAVVLDSFQVVLNVLFLYLVIDVSHLLLVLDGFSELTGHEHSEVFLRIPRCCQPGRDFYYPSVMLGLHLMRHSGKTSNKGYYKVSCFITQRSMG